MKLTKEQAQEIKDQQSQQNKTKRVTAPELEGMRIELQAKIDAQDELNITLDETITELQVELEKVATGGD